MEMTKNRGTTAQMAHSPPKPHTAPSHDPTMSTREATMHTNGEATQTHEETPQGMRIQAGHLSTCDEEGKRNRSGHGRMRWNRAGYDERDASGNAFPRGGNLERELLGQWSRPEASEEALV
ncbi:hypothetical protein JB92DRAFT_2838249 [Gautieria morchelliformis]|nr:hypothetical protein JB92DRAFT_2838249 [Gautieria morchelliformis]